MSSRRVLALGLLAWLGCALAPGGASAANRCAGGGGPRPDEGGIGGTGVQQPAPDEDGIGGTGLHPGGGEEDSGIGGTGISAADTGVIGTITGFASICVGGVEIHYDAGSQVRIDGRAASTAELAVGQVVEVVASGSGDELTARQIGVSHVVAGPVTRVDAERNEIDVIGQTVRLSSTTRGDESGAAASDFATGTVVEVSGLRQLDGSIAASRIARGAGDAAWLSGAVSTPSADTITVAGTRVRVIDGSVLAAGDEVRVAGRWDGSQLVAGEVDRLPSLPFDGRPGRLEIEGFASAAAAGKLRVGAYVFELAPGVTADALRAAANDRVRIEAVIDDGRAVIEHLGAAPALPPRPDRPADATGMRPLHPPPDGGRPAGDIGGRAGMPGPPDGGRPDAMLRPDRPDRPAGPPLPDRPPPIERPPVPDRVGIPERPPRIDRPFRPERPGP